MISCSQVQAALSARLDGESSPLADDVIDSHVQGCVDCRRFLEQSALLNRKLAFNDAIDAITPDLADQIIAGVEPTWRQQQATRAWVMAVIRVGLVLMAAWWFFWAIRLLGTTGITEVDPIFAQVLVEEAAMRLALGFGLVFVAWLPRIAGGLVPLYGALWMFSLGFGVRDLVLGTITTDGFVHLGSLFLTTALLGGLWLADQGWALVTANLRSLGAGPVP